MKKSAIVFAMLFMTTLAFTKDLRATASYDGTLSGSISVAGCLSGVIIQNCALSGLIISGSAGSSTPVTIITGGGVASATQNVTAGSGNSYSISSAISGSASAPGSSGTSLTFPGPTFFISNTTSNDITLLVDYSFVYANSVAVDLPLTETAFSFSNFDINRTDSLLGVPFNFQELFTSGCSNIAPAQLGLTSDPCANSGSGRLTVEIDGCDSPACVAFRVTAISVDSGQIGAAAVIPEPDSLLLVGWGLAQLGVFSLRRYLR